MAKPGILRGVGVGAGYFSAYQYEAWNRLPEVAVTALASRDRARGEARAAEFGIARWYGDWREMLEVERPDFVDLITPPETHREMCAYAAERGIHIICQKPLAPNLEEAQAIVAHARAAGVRFMVHENWRWQPWYREIKRLLATGALGEPLSLYFRMRTGDGWGPHAYLARQPFFREYPRLLVYETGVHFLDTFRYLLGEPETITARLRRLNPIIRGEDCGILLLTFAGGVTAIWDASRYHESEASDPRYTFGELRLDTTAGHLVLDSDGIMRIKPLGEPMRAHEYPHSHLGFGGDCVYALQRHFVACMLSDTPFESSGEDYLRTARLVEAAYESAARGQTVPVGETAVGDHSRPAA